MTPTTTTLPPGTPSAAPVQDAKADAGRPTTMTVLGWELRKLAAQKRTWLGLVASALAPLILVAAMSLQNTPLPKDISFGRYIRDSGLAGPLVLLGFGGIFFSRWPTLVSAHYLASALPRP